MNTSYIKLKAKDRLVKNHFNCFIVSILPYLTFFSLLIFNYYLYSFLKNTHFDSISSYSVYVKSLILTLSISFSFVLWRTMRFLSDYYFFMKNNGEKIHFFSLIKKVSLRQLVTSSMASILKFFLSVAWGTLYLFPCVIVTGVFIYAFKYEDFNRNLLTTLFVAVVILFFIGVSFLYFTMKRYTMTDAVIFTSKEKDSIKAIEQSIELMEGNTVKYALYCLSFFGWLLSCILVVPLFYVLPYKVMAKYSFYNGITKSTVSHHPQEKPIIFYVTKTAKEKVWENSQTLIIKYYVFTN